MFPSFIGILDIQSWWEVPSIAHFCSLFRAAFNLLDFDIEELEEALLTDGTEESASSLLTELIVRLLCGCLGNNDISAFNYQMFLRRLFRQKCQETGRYNPFNTDIDFQFLPLRTKVEILFALCDFRLDADDVFDLFKNLEAESLRVEPLGWDSNSSAYWYFYGTRLYREDYKVKPKGKKRKKDDKKTKSDEFEDDTERVWQVVCFTESDWINLTEKFKGSSSKLERDLYQSLSENFLPEIPRLFQEKERLQRKRLLELAPRRTSSRVQIKQKQKEEEEWKQAQDTVREKKIEVEIQQHKKKTDNLERESRVRRREKLRTQSEQSGSSDSSNSGTEDSKDMWPKRKKRKLKTRESSLTSPSTTTMSTTNTTTPPKPTGRQTNNSLACATGQIVIPDIREPTNPTRKKVKSSQIYELLDQDLVVDMYKVLEQLKSHEDAWPFMDPVEEDYAPNYYTVIRRPMDLKRMEERLDQGYYTAFSMFKNDFKLIVNNCRLYNGQESEYTKMVNNLEGAFNKLTQRYFEGESSSDDEIAIEYPIQNPYPRKQSVSKRSHKNSTKNDYEDNQKEDDSGTKSSEKRKSNDNYDDIDQEEEENLKKSKKFKTSSQNSDDKVNSSLEKKERGKNKTGHLKKKKKLKRLQDARKSRKDKHKKTKDKKKHSKHNTGQKREKKGRRTTSSDKYRSRSNSRSSQVNEDRPVAIKRHSSPEIDFYKDKFDKIKERRRGCVKDYSFDKHKEKKANLSVPEKDKHLNLKETIEKLKAKSESVKPHPIYNDIYESEDIPIKKEKKKLVDFDSPFLTTDVKKKSGDEYEFVDDDELAKENSAKKQVNTKNESAREALEQAMKDINKWLDDTPKLSEFGSNSNSPLQIPITDEYNISPVIKQDDETSNSQTEKEKTGISKKDGTRKRQSNKDPAKTVPKKKEVQRTIDRLQPGKSKGNLISNIQTTTKQEENVIAPIVKAKEMKNSLIMKAEEGSPKLSLGTVLPTVGFGLGKQHNFTAEQNAANAVKVEVVDMGTMTGENEEPPVEEPAPEVTVEEPEVVKEKEVEPAKPEEVMKQCQEKATPNLSAWFKAFGAPKSVAPSTPLSKKKTEDFEQDDSKIDDKNTSPLDSVKNEQGDDLLGADGSESPIGNLGSTIRARRTSTGSSISERSSFSQDLDSPRHQPSHPSPLLRSPASPRTEDIQKTYPLMNVTVRVGFYQDTTSVKSSPEKSCSPREAPQSPYTNYSQHVYASSTNGNNSNNPALAYSTEGSNKSPIPAYAQSPYYENVKANTTKPNEDFTVYSSDNAYQQPSSPFSPGKSPYSHHSQHSPYSHVQSPQTSTAVTSTPSNIIQTVERRPMMEKSSAFPVKKRSYDISKDNVEDEACLQIRQPPTPLSTEGTSSNIPASEEGFTGNQETVNNPSVITSTLSKSVKPPNIGYPYDPLVSRDLSKQIKDDFPNKSLLSQYPDYASDYSIKKSQVNDYSLAGLSKVHPDVNPSGFMDSQHGQQSVFGDVKNIAKGYTHDYSLKDKQVDMVNMGYSSKMLESMKNKDNVDMVNMGYMQSEAHSHLAKLSSNPDDLRNYYNPPSALSYAGRIDPNAQVSKGTSVSDHMDINKRYGFNEKANSVLQYMKSSEMNPAHNTDLLQLNPSMLRPESNKQSAQDNSDNFVRTDQMYKDWMKKNQDAHNLSLYKDNQSKADGNKMSISQMATSSLSNVGGRTSDTPTYDTTNPTGSPEETLHKNQTELRVQPGSGVHFIRAVIKISSSIKPETQPPTTPEYNLRRNVNLNLPIPTTKSETPSYDRNPSLTSTNTYKPTPHTQFSHPIDQSLLNIPNLPQIMERYAKDERMLSPYPPTPVSSAAYQDKNLPLMFPKNMNTVHGSMSSSQMYQSPSVPKSYVRPDNPYSQSPQPSNHNWPTEPISLESDKKVKSRKKKTATPVASTPPSTSSPSYHNYSTPKPSLPTSDPSMSLKPPNILPGSAFNFGTPGSLASSLYGDSSYFLDPSTNQYMAANYIAAHQRSTPEIDKGGKPAHSSTPFQFLTPQVRPGYPLVGMESPSIYQQYIQRQQEEFLRPLHSQIMGMFPPGYNPSLGGRQPFDSIPRPWL